MCLRTPWFAAVRQWMVVWLLLLALTPASALGQPRKKLKVAVFGFTPAAGVNPRLADLLREELLGEISKYETLSVVRNNQMDRMAGCSDDFCMIELGAALNADVLVYGVLEQIGDMATFRLRLLDMRTARVERQVQRQGPEGDKGALFKLIAPALAELFPGRRPAAPAAPTKEKPEQGQAVAPPAAVIEKEKPGRGPWPWVVGGAGVALLGMGGAFTAVNHANFNELKRTAQADPRRKELESAVDRNRALAITGYATGGAALAVGVAWLLWPENRNAKEETAKTWNMRPLLAPAYAGVELRW